MTKTRRNLTLTAVQRIGRPVFTTREIAALRGASVAATSNGLKRLAATGLVQKVVKGIWCRPADPRFSPFSLVPYLVGSHTAYVSFLSALYLHGVVGQIPQAVQAATTAHTKVVSTSFGTYSFHQLGTGFFTGYDWHSSGHFLIATPEKALVDCLYLSSRRRKRFGHFPELDLEDGFSAAKARTWLEHIEAPRIRSYVARKLERVVASRKL